MLFIVANLILVNLALDKTEVPQLGALPKYFINVENIRCKTTNVDGYRYHDMIIESYGYNFIALDIKLSTCQDLRKQIPKEADVDIWHEDGIILQLGYQDKILLSYKQLRRIIENNQSGEGNVYWYLIVALWFTLFKSLANALIPGTYTQDE